jgi:hypothetical protein
MPRVEELAMWLRELAAVERSCDNYAVGDKVLAGIGLAKAQAEVQAKREERSGGIQRQMMEAPTAAKRTRVAKDALATLWERLEDRPDAVLQRVSHQPVEDMDTVVGRCVEESCARTTELTEKGLDVADPAHSGFLWPHDRFAELEVKRLNFELSAVKQQLAAAAPAAADTPAAADEMPDLEVD